MTVVAQDPAELGRQAATVLFQRMDAGPAAPRRIVIPTRLVQRGSGELPSNGNRGTAEGNQRSVQKKALDLSSERTRLTAPRTAARSTALPH